MVLVSVNGFKFKVHLADPGRLKDLLVPKSKVLMLKKRNFRGENSRKTKYEVLAFRKGDLWVVTNSMLHNQLAEEVLSKRLIEELKGYTVAKREYFVGGGRIDFLLEGFNGKKCLLEVKGCTLVKNGVALFPDAPTKRGRRHVEELVKALSLNMEAAVLFLIMRSDAQVFKPNKETDPEFTESLRKAYEEGVKIFAYSFILEGKEIKPLRRVPVKV